MPWGIHSHCGVWLAEAVDSLHIVTERLQVLARGVANASDYECAQQGLAYGKALPPK